MMGAVTPETRNYFAVDIVVLIAYRLVIDPCKKTDSQYKLLTAISFSVQNTLTYLPDL